MADKARKKIINYGGIELEVYQLPNLTYTLSRSQIAFAIDQKRGNSSVNDFLNTKSPEALACKDLEEVSVDVGEGCLKIKSCPPQIAISYWTYHAKKGNVKADNLLKAIYSKDLDQDPLFSKYKGKNLVISLVETKEIKPKKQGFIYLIQAGNLDIVKIGFSFSPKNRLKDLQISHFEELKIIALKKGTLRGESNLHSRFSDFRIRGEWFSFSDEIKLFFDLPLNLDKYLKI